MKSITVTELKEKFESKESFTLLDVREENEISYAKIDPHKNIPSDKKTPIVVMCHSGVRSAQVCQYLEPLGYNVANLEGGIQEWSLIIDPSVPQY